MKQLALLAFLVLHANEVVPRDVLIEELWLVPPSGARHALDVHVSGLRHTLGLAAARSLVETGTGGYVVHADPGQIDVRCFETLVADGREALAREDPRLADDLMTEALALWRGTPLPGLASYRFAEFEAARLEDLRLTTVEDRCQARLLLGRHEEVVDELTTVVATHPYREYARRLLMLGLCAAERQADALAVYREGRRVLAEELGIEPDEELRRLERSILEHRSSRRRISPPPPGESWSPALSTAGRTSPRPIR